MNLYRRLSSRRPADWKVGGTAGSWKDAWRGSGPVRNCLALALVLFAGCERPRTPGVWQGYVEGEYVYVAAPLGGELVTLAVERGQNVTNGQALFGLESAAEASAVREAESRLTQGRERLANLRKGLRPSELAALEAQLARAQANLALARIELERGERLIADQVIAPAELDSARARRDAEAAQVKALEAELETARLGAREDEIRAAEADVASLTATLERAQWSLDQKQRTAPTNAVVHDTLYRAGEYVPAGIPVVALLPPAYCKVRFFVPEPELAAVRSGAPVTVSFDGAAAPMRAVIAYVSTQAEFTPPVIYSQENRAKLVFMVEARPSPDEAPRLHPGQPVDVRRGE